MPILPHGIGRGAPDVSALSQGNMGYLLPGSNMLGVYPNGGTSAATPFWAALATEFNAIFKDQGLPNLGYSNDLYYIAAAIAPASFNDITAGNNVSTFIPGSTYTSPQLGGISATGLGYAAGQGYDHNRPRLPQRAAAGAGAVHHRPRRTLL